MQDFPQGPSEVDVVDTTAADEEAVAEAPSLHNLCVTQSSATLDTLLVEVGSCSVVSLAWALMYHLYL